MKKTIVVWVLMAMAGATAAVGQDTISSKWPADNYFYNYWDDTSYAGSTMWGLAGMWGEGVDVKGLCTKDSLTVYGIAASLFSLDHLRRDNPQSAYWDVEEDFQRELLKVRDTSLDSSYEYLVLYTRDSSGQKVQANQRLLVNLGQTPVSYYQDLGILGPMPEYFDLQSFAVPVYERYFDTPSVVFDSFYVGFTAIYSWEENVKDSAGRIYPYKTWQVRLLDKGTTYYAKSEPLFHRRMEDTNYWACVYRSKVFAFVFPILTPNPDTVGIDTTEVDTTVVDTTGWRVGGEGSMEVDSNVWIHKLGVEDVLLERYVQLMPNPAEDRVRVISSFGLVGLEIYGADGRKVRDERLDGLAADVDVGGLPRGVYMVRILTPRGDTTKRLVLR